VRLAFLRREQRRQRLGPRARRPHLVRHGGGYIGGRQDEAFLPPADEFELNLRQKLGIEQGPVFGAARQVDGETLAQFVE